MVEIKKETENENETEK
jgi:hypothetical protein